MPPDRGWKLKKGALMASISGMLITVRTSRQGAAMEKGKFTPEYLEEIAMLSVCPTDCEALGLAPGKRARLTSQNGEVIVTCRTVDGPRGIFFLPLGPTANQLIGGETHGTGVPNFKGVAVTLKSDPGISEQAESTEDVHT
jgi:formylmethanofuran dehydrogenase subunit D